MNVRRWSIGIALLCVAASFSGCSHSPGNLSGTGRAIPPAKAPRPVPRAGAAEIADLVLIPQLLDPLAATAEPRLALAEATRQDMLQRFLGHFFAPWEEESSLDPAESAGEMRREGRAAWYGINERRVSQSLKQEILDNCALDSFPSRSLPAIAVAPGHLRGLPTKLPFFAKADSYPFDMLSYPQVKLNEPLRVRHASRDGVWLFVETGYSSGWVERRDVALVNRDFIDVWTKAPHLVVIRDYLPVPDGTGAAVFQAKVGTVLPGVESAEGGWQALVASPGPGGNAVTRAVLLPREAAEPFPLPFTVGNLARVGDQMLGQPYGWGEIYDLRDCSALLRDFFLPFGIWLPRTSGDQIASLPQRLNLAGLSPAEKEEVIRNNAVPFLTLLHKPGHIMLYLGTDATGRLLAFHDSWSVSVRKNAAEVNEEGETGNSGAQTRIIGMVAITTLEPGKELGLVPGSSILERLVEMGTIVPPAP